MSKLESIAAEGFTSTAVEAAINTIEFSLRENNTGSFPRGLSLMLRAMASWIYDKDPFQPLQWTKDLEHFKVRPCSPPSCSTSRLHCYGLRPCADLEAGCTPQPCHDGRMTSVILASQELLNKEHTPSLDS